MIIKSSYAKEEVLYMNKKKYFIIGLTVIVLFVTIVIVSVLSGSNTGKKSAKVLKQTETDSQKKASGQKNGSDTDNELPTVQIAGDESKSGAGSAVENGNSSFSDKSDSQQSGEDAIQNKNSETGSDDKDITDKNNDADKNDTARRQNGDNNNTGNNNADRNNNGTGDKNDNDSRNDTGNNNDNNNDTGDKRDNTESTEKPDKSGSDIIELPFVPAS